MPYAPVREQWMDDAACTEIGPEFWFPELGESSGVARTICGRCPVVNQCLEFALGNDIRHGIWGNTSPVERAALRRGSAA